MLKSIMLFSALLISSTAMAKVMTFSSKTLELARIERHISAQTLIIKIKTGSQFIERSRHLGEFESFFNTSEGTWGYFKLNMLPDAQSASLVLSDLSGDEDILHAYYAPIARNAVIDEIQEIKETPEVATPNFEARQNYLEDAPKGVGARSAWKLPGGTGSNVKVIDIETCFNDTHEDFKTPFYIGNNPTCESTDHGDAVWGEVAAKNDGKGVTGIAHGAEFGIFGFIEGDLADVNEEYIFGINKAIQGAMDNLDAGDVMIIEQQMVGPDLKKYTAVEFWPHIFEQLKAATDKGIHCLEAAGNGDSNFDDRSYGGAFDLSKRDSGCVMVGAVGPTDYERLSFSNYGARVDAAGFGRNVVTAGYGELFNGGKGRNYTARFSGTSSATPIVSGAVAVVSSIAKEQGIVISPQQMRKALRATGTPQGTMTSAKRVGNFPVIKQMMKELGL